MSATVGEFASPGFEAAIAARAAACGIRLDEVASRALADHARAVLDANARLHLTTLTDPDSFLERHLGEAFEGATLLPEGASGLLVDVGSGNGYPALPLAAARPGLAPLLVEASVKKTAFLQQVLGRLGAGEVLGRQVQRAADLEEILGQVRVITARAVGGWSRILPKLAALLAPEGDVLLWAGREVEAVRKRVAWRRYALREVRELPGREQSAVWAFRRA